MKTSLHPISVVTHGNERIYALVALLVFFFSLLILPRYSGGDQVGYTSAYDIIAGIEPMKAWSYYLDYITSNEPIHFAISIIGSTLAINKDLWFSLFNAILAVQLMRILHHWGVNIYLSTSMIFTNFYILVLYLAAERLKFGFLFIAIALLPRKGMGWRMSFMILSVLSHVSMLFPIASIWLLTTRNMFTDKKPKPMEYTFLALAILLVLLFSFTQQEYLFRKVNAYMPDEIPFNQLLPILALAVYSIVRTKEWVFPTLIFSPFFIGIAVVGSTRLNMFVFFCFLFLMYRAKLKYDPLLLLLLLYFTYKSLGFLWNIFQYGSGFK
ncbi:hypothetical protein [Lentilitoribacter sp. Alg239-R112]|uniref:hypothetical protein n=1 Tax=Lentilitoribacter sp. Alg239-R112 TaxID=2305987 RepID=UPI0013A70881|nr:hypothetical protein [Lentilitoribacter sp. Alg239-R112]